MKMKRFSVGSLLVVLALVGRAEAQSGHLDREQFLTWFDSDDGRKLAVMMWTTGANETLHFFARMAGCESAPTSARTLASAIADLLRQDSTTRPINTAIIAYRKLSGCSEKLYRALTPK